MNKVTIQPTKFVSLSVVNKEELIKWGVRVTDNYDSSYDDKWNQSEVDIRFNEEAQIYEPVDSLSIIERTCRSDDFRITDIIADVIENQSGVWVGSEYLEWEQIKEVVVGPT